MDAEMSSLEAAIEKDESRERLAAAFSRLHRYFIEVKKMKPNDAAAISIQLASRGPPYMHEGVNISEELARVSDNEKNSEGASDHAVSDDHAHDNPQESNTDQGSDTRDTDSAMDEDAIGTATSADIKDAAKFPNANACPAAVTGKGDDTVHYITIRPTDTLQFSSVSKLMSECRQSGDFSPLMKLVYAVFSSPENLSGSFLNEEEVQLLNRDEVIKVEAGMTCLPFDVDLDAVDDMYTDLIRDAPSSVINGLKNAAESLLSHMQYSNVNQFEAIQARMFLILMEHPMLLDPDYYKGMFSSLCKLTHRLPASCKAVLQHHWAQSKSRFRGLLNKLQQFVTIRLFACENMLHTSTGSATDILGAISIMSMLQRINATSGFVAYEEFYNDAVNAEVDLRDDYKMWREAQDEGLLMGQVDSWPLDKLSLCNYPFILDPSSKSKLMQLDARVQMRAEFRGAVLRSILVGRTNPYLVLKVNRDNIIQDTLQQLAMMPNEDLKKPLRVKFVGEEGIDEGGVQKEFFQVIIRQLLDPAYGMFNYDEESRTLWFNSHSLESSMEFELIGILLGVAIYNGVILDVHFPMVVYKRLLDLKPTLDDLKNARPELGRGLQQLLDFKGNVENVFQRTFQISFEVYGEIKTIDLKPKGGDLAVTQANKAEYVELYVEYLLEKSVARQFDPFHKGFHLVAGSDILKMFRAEELELLICGSPELDFDQLEQVTRYEDGFTSESRCIKNFWQIVHQMSDEEQRKLLTFCTGSDRVPINGLSNLTFVVSRNGPDSDRLPTAHTCFNHLLLPDYSSYEKLKDRLLVAINQAEGFGLM